MWHHSTHWTCPTDRLNSNWESWSIIQHDTLVRKPLNIHHYAINVYGHIVGDTTSRNTTHYHKHQHSVSYGQENHFHDEILFSDVGWFHACWSQTSPPTQTKWRTDEQRKQRADWDMWPCLKDKSHPAQRGSYMGGFSNSPGGQHSFVLLQV